MHFPILSRYRIVAELGRGGMGVVYRAEDTRLGRAVALKFLPAEVAGDPVALERFRREARAASALNHPHICTIHDIDEEDGRYFIVMEALEGQTLAALLSAQRLKIDTAIELSLQIAEALGAAHAKGIIHRDIKPANIFITDGGHAKVLDFGLAKLAADDDATGETATMMPGSANDNASPPITAPGQTLGTVAYMSPEQVRGEALDARTDIFSFGATLYEMIAGRRPFTGATTGVITDAILNRAPQTLQQLTPAVPAGLVHIVDKALEKDRDLRYQGMREMRADLARVKRDGPTSGVFAVPSATHRRGRGLAVAGIVVALAAGAAYFAWNRPAVIDSSSTPVRALTRITFDEGVQGQPAWSPDGKFIAYVSNHGGNVDIWVQPLARGRAVRVTSDPANDWQPDWSPDGNNLVFRSERDGGGIFMVPALGGAERKLADFGYTPRWRPDGSSVLVVRKVPFFVGGGSLVQQAYLLSPEGSPPTRILEKELAEFTGVAGMMWHPDGQRVTFFGRRIGTPPAVQIWTAPVSGGSIAQSEGSTEFDKQTAALELYEMRWAPKGDALLLHARTRGVSNLWRVAVDPKTLRYHGLPERLTTGPGRDDELAVSPDGTRVAFVTSQEITRLWSIPFDAVTRRTGEPTPLTAASVETGSFDLAADGTSLAYIGLRPGANDMQLWSASLAGGPPTLLREAFFLSQPRLSRGGDRVVFGVREARGKPLTYPWMNVAGRDEHTAQNGTPHDWSPDGRSVIGNCGPPPPNAICTTKIDDAAAPRVRLISDPGYHLWQGRYSPDGRWILFNAQDVKQSSVSILGVAPAAGGAWRRLTDPQLWADKARWAPDGKTIYFISNRESAFFDVWGIGFDPEKGTVIGEEFRVTRFTDPARRLLSSSGSELGVGGDRIVVPIVERSGGVWLLDQIDR